jgi:hypothetical protein
VSDLSKTEIDGMDLDGKIRLLERIAQQILDLQIEIAPVAGKYAELRANLEVLKQVKSALQSAIRAEMTQ